MTIKAILFDKDGTLIDVNRTWIPLYRKLLTIELDATPSAVETLLVKAGYDPVSNSFLPGSVLGGGTTRQLVALWWPALDTMAQQKMARRIDHEYAPMARQYLKPLLDLVPVFEGLKKLGLRLGVATNDSVASASGQMQALAVEHYFEQIIGADTVEIAKPSGQMIQHFSAQSGLACDEIAMVGDNTHDMEEALHGGAGMAIGVLSGNARHQDIAHLAHHIFDDVSALPSFFAEHRSVL